MVFGYQVLTFNQKKHKIYHKSIFFFVLRKKDGLKLFTSFLLLELILQIMLFVVN